MSVIFPGNYVAHLNAYREQGVEALPGVEFYRIVGALVLDPDNAGTLSGGVLAAGTYNLKVLSPDLRQDDKPRTDKAFVIPKDSVVYRTALNAPGMVFSRLLDSRPNSKAIAVFSCVARKDCSPPTATWLSAVVKSTR